MSIGTKKYRPYFSSDEMIEIIHALKENPNAGRLALIRYLEGFNIKIERGIMQPSHELIGTKNQQLAQSLGFDGNKLDNPDPKSLYQKWQNDPTTVSPEEIKMILQYRWENNLMTDKESADYENQLMMGTM